MNNIRIRALELIKQTPKIGPCVKATCRLLLRINQEIAGLKTCCITLCCKEQALTSRKKTRKNLKICKFLQEQVSVSGVVIHAWFFVWENFQPII